MEVGRVQQPKIKEISKGETAVRGAVLSVYKIPGDCNRVRGQYLMRVTLWVLKTPGMGQGLESKGRLEPCAKVLKKGGRSGDSRTEVRG